MIDSKPTMSRGSLLQKLAVAPIAIGALAAIRSEADAKGSKAAFKYQDHPNGKKMCSVCSLFIPGKTPTAAGTCRAVAGAISPHGYCIAFSPKA